jgi:hypothetical protein
MLACKKCGRELSEGASQQSISEIEATLLTRKSRIESHRKAMKLGPLCDSCLADWQAKEKAAAAPQESEPHTVPDTRSPTRQRLAEACLVLGNGMDPHEREASERRILVIKSELGALKHSPAPAHISRAIDLQLELRNLMRAIAADEGSRRG